MESLHYIETRLLSKIKRFARVTLAGRAKPEEEAEEEAVEEAVEDGEEIIIVVEEDGRKAAPGVKVELKEDLKEMESTSSPPSSSSTVSPVWESRKLIGRGGWRQIGPSKASWRGHLEEEEEEEEEENEARSAEGGRSRSSEARGRSLELDKLSQETEVEEEVVKEQGIVALGRAEGRVALRREKESTVRREGRMVVERATGVDLLKFTNFLIVTVGVAVFIILSSGIMHSMHLIFSMVQLILSACGYSGLPA